MNFSDFKERFERACEREKSVSALTDYPMMREGQIAWNELYDVRPDLCREIMGAKDTSLIDPFSDNSRIPAFLSFVESNW